MPRLRFSIAGLLAAIAFAAIGCAALAHPSYLWVTLVRSFVLAALLLAAARVAAVFCPQSSRAAGFMLWTTLYLVVNWDEFRFWIYGQQPRLPTTQLTQYLAARLGLHSSVPPTPVLKPAEFFYETGHYLWAALFGVLGAAITPLFARRAIAKRIAESGPTVETRIPPL